MYVFIERCCNLSEYILFEIEYVLVINFEGLGFYLDMWLDGSEEKLFKL